MSTRRDLLKQIGVALAAGMGLAVGVPAAAFYTFPTRKRTVSGGEEPVEVAALAQLPDGTPVRVPVKVARRLDAWTAFTDVTLGSAWLLREGERVRAWSTVCPHLGCAVDWEPARKQFNCPCHGSCFSADGTPQSGPSPRPMDALDVQVADGHVRVRYLHFRPGVPQKDPV